MRVRTILFLLLGFAFMFQSVSTHAMMKAPKPSDIKKEYKRVTLTKDQTNNMLYFRSNQDFKIGVKNTMSGYHVQAMVIEVDSKTLYPVDTGISSLYHYPSVSTKRFDLEKKIAFYMYQIPIISVKTYPGEGHTYQLIIESLNNGATGEAIIFPAKDEVPKDYEVTSLVEEIN